MKDAVLSVMGQAGQSFGFILFSCLEDFDAFGDAADAMQNGEVPSIPPHFALSYERGAEMSPSLRKEVARHEWEVTNRDAYPWLIAVEEDLVARPPANQEFALVEAIALSLPRFLKDKRALHHAWEGGPAVERSLIVRTFAGDLEVSFAVPCEEPPYESVKPGDLLAELAELEATREELEPEARRPIEKRLINLFLKSPEAKGLDGGGYYQLVMDFAANYFDTTLARLRPGELRAEGVNPSETVASRYY